MKTSEYFTGNYAALVTARRTTTQRHQKNARYIICMSGGLYIRNARHDTKRR